MRVDRKEFFKFRSSDAREIQGYYLRLYEAGHKTYMEKMCDSCNGPPKLLTAPLIGYRVNALDRSGFLVSSQNHTIWPPKEPLEAVHGEQTAPHDPSCWCGINAYRELSGPETIYGQNKVIVKVALWGKVYKFREGYRAQYAYPLGFFVSQGIGGNRAIYKACQRYGVPVLGSVLKQETQTLTKSAFLGSGRQAGKTVASDIYKRYMQNVKSQHYGTY